MLVAWAITIVIAAILRLSSAGVLGPTTRELKSVMGAAFHPPTKHAAISPAVFKKKYVMGLPSAIEVTGRSEGKPASLAEIAQNYRNLAMMRIFKRSNNQFGRISKKPAQEVADHEAETNKVDEDINSFGWIDEGILKNTLSRGWMDIFKQMDRKFGTISGHGDSVHNNPLQYKVDEWNKVRRGQTNPQGWMENLKRLENQFGWMSRRFPQEDEGKVDKQLVEVKQDQIPIRRSHRSDSTKRDVRTSWMTRLW